VVVRRPIGVVGIIAGLLITWGMPTHSDGFACPLREKNPSRGHRTERPRGERAFSVFV
jgi:hypothetical protein